MTVTGRVAARSVAQPPVRAGRPVQWRAARWYWLFVLPALALFCLVTLYPTVEALRLSLYETLPFGPKQFAGLANYERMLQDPLFWKSLRVSGVWTLVVVPVVAVLGLLVAVVINNHWIKGSGFWRTLYFAPVMTSIVAAALTFRWMFDPTVGLINTVLRWFGVRNPPDWLASPQWALPAVMIVAIWQQLGYAMILFLTGLQTIPAHFAEASELDGADAWQRFRYVTFPLLNPTVVLVTVILVINAFRVFTLPYVMTSTGLAQTSPGGPVNATRVFVFNIYDSAWGRNDFGYGAANATVLLMLTVVVSVVQIRVTQRKIDY